MTHSTHAPHTGPLGPTHTADARRYIPLPTKSKIKQMIMCHLNSFAPLSFHTVWCGLLRLRIWSRFIENENLPSEMFVDCTGYLYIIATSQGGSARTSRRAQLSIKALYTLTFTCARSTPPPDLEVLYPVPHCRHAWPKLRARSRLMPLARSI